ncbi:hypothetical protein MMPV_000220 [Pyropia vietnamensis]
MRAARTPPVGLWRHLPPPAGPVTVASLRGGPSCCRARAEGVVAAPSLSRTDTRATAVGSFATGGWAAAGRSCPRPTVAVGRPAGPPVGGARSLRAALVNKKGAGAEESLGIPSAPAESELVPGDTPSPPSPAAAAGDADKSASPGASRRSKKGGGSSTAASGDRASVALPSLTSLKAPQPSEDQEKAAAMMDEMASDAVQQLTAQPPSADADADEAGGSVDKAKAFFAALRGELAIVDWPETQRVAQILGLVFVAMILSSVGIYVTDKLFMRMSSVLFGIDY